MLKQIARFLLSAMMLYAVPLSGQSVSGSLHVSGQQAWVTGIQAQSFTLVLWPDTQHEVDSYTSVLKTQADWVCTNKTALNIQAVMGLGDISESAQVAEFQAADTYAYGVLDACSMPYTVPPGNHDMDHVTVRDYTEYTNYNLTFGPSRFTGKAWYGGNYPVSSNAESYITFTVGSQNWLILATSVWPDSNELAWAQGVINAHPGYLVIFHTHGYMDNNGGYCNTGNLFGYTGPASPQIEGWDNTNSTSGQDMWTNFIAANPQIWLVTCGHIGNCVPHRSNAANDGHIIHQILQDFEDLANGGDGYMTIYQFKTYVNGSALKGTLNVSTYSAYLGSYLTGPQYQFSLSW